jgi:hypothetical protein
MEYSSSPRSIEIFLTSYSISLAHERRKLIIQLRLVAQPEVVHAIAPPERIDAMKERRFDSTF